MKFGYQYDFFNLNKNREYIVSSLSERIPIEYKMEFIEIINYVIDNNDVFRRKELEGSFYDGEDKTLDLILPAISRVFIKVFKDPPPLFKDNPHDDGIRLKLFQLKFDIDEFNEYLVDMLISSKGILDEFTNLDRTAETISLIVDNYIGGLLQDVLDTYDIDKKVDELSKQKERDRKIKQITGD